MLMGRKEIASSEKELAELIKKTKMLGLYPYITNYEEFEKLNTNQKEVDKLFTRLMIQTLEEWLKFAEERLKESGIKCFITPGNDDKFEIDPIFEQSTVVVNPEGKVVYIDENHEMISTGFSNITPWKCPRDIPEEELEKKIEEMMYHVKDSHNCIFNLHVPPYNTKLDIAPKLDKNLKVVVMMGNPIMEPVGSLAVRRMIEKYQPLLGLHGHIHESKNTDKIGRTLIINPGSEYSEGILHGALIELDEKGIKNYMLVEG
jgi:Icc-related predicted phosphoesterase